jgi:hypothetical protein
MSRSHAVWDNDDPSPPPIVVKPACQMRLWCKRCGDRYLIVLPASLTMVSGILRLFGDEHAACKPRGGGDEPPPSETTP